MVKPNRPVRKRNDRPKENYVDKQAMFDAYVAYAKVRDENIAAGLVSLRSDCKNTGLPPQQIPNYLGDCINKICNHLSYAANFIGYPFRDEMVDDAIENCFMYFDNFDPNRSKQIFSYYTQIAYFAFLRRIDLEKEELYAKHKILENSSLFSRLSEQQETDNNVVELKTDLCNDYMNDFVKNFEESMEKKKIKKKKEPQGLEQFMEQEEENDPANSNDNPPSDQ